MPPGSKAYHRSIKRRPRGPAQKKEPMTTGDRRGQTVPPLHQQKIPYYWWLLSLLFLNVRGDTDITKNEGLTTLWFNSSNTQVATYILKGCEIYMCPKQHIAIYAPNRWQWYEDSVGEAYICVTHAPWDLECSYWGAAGWNTGTPWGYRPQQTESSLFSRLSIIKTGNKHMKVTINLKEPRREDRGVYVLGWWFGGGNKGHRAQFKLNDMFQNDEYQYKGNNPLKPHITSFKEMISISNPTYEDVITVETGFSDLNLWLEWMKYSADQHNQSNCYVCSGARPHLGTVPLNIPQGQDDCFLSLYTGKYTNETECKLWKKNYPILAKNANPGNTITVYPGNYTCYNSTADGGRNLGILPPGYCSETRVTNTTNHTRSLGDIYWLCGDLKLRTKLESPWKGQYALAKIIMPMHIFPDDPKPQEPPSSPSRRKRATPGGSLDPHVYIDAIGVPRGVPYEFKARDQVAAGFESFFAPMVTINKNVDWINYIYYNQQRFVNYTKDALKGVAEQLEAVSQMTFQNRMALDMMLADKGGTCVYIGKVEGCCTYIPDNTGPQGKVTLAIRKLDDLSKELERNSGISNPWEQYFSWATNWKQALIQIAIYVVIFLVLMTVIFFCIIPCCKRICAKTIDQTIMYEAVLATHTPEGYKQYLVKQRSQKNHII